MHLFIGTFPSFDPAFLSPPCSGSGSSGYRGRRDKGSLPAERPGLEDLDFDGEESRRDPFGVRRTEPGGYPAFDRLREPPALGALARSPGPDGSGRGGTRGAGA